MANDCDILTNTTIATTQSLRVQSEILSAKLLKDHLSECFDVKENVNSDFSLYHFNEATRFENCRYELNFHSKKYMICLEIIICKR